jgi:hypothetical protein
MQIQVLKVKPRVCGHFLSAGSTMPDVPPVKRKYMAGLRAAAMS